MPRGKTAARGYGAQHQALRKQWAPLVATGTVTCWRCGHLIAANAEWDLGHDDQDRTVYRGPEHRAPNRLAGARKGGRVTSARRRKRRATQPAASIQQPPTAARW